jgi:cytochrome c biogenesis protein CcmG/thiol:disulfide interchange protein DsbE
MNLGRWVPLAVLVALVAAFWSGLQRDPTIVPSPFIGKPAPQFDLPSLVDPAQRVRTADFAGQVWVLNVWGTWCAGCLQEHPSLLALQAQGGVPIVGLDWKDDPQAARRWLQERGDPYVATAVDADGRAAIDWGVYGAPETFVVDKRGIVRHKHTGPLLAADLEHSLLPLLAQLRAESP